MPPSQLKRLKASLRESGITGPQKSKKERKRQYGAGGADQRLKRQAAILALRDSFNPFEIQTTTKNAKFASATDRTPSAATVRPGATKSLGERNRRQNLLPELQNRNKVGGIVDRRIGEDDSTMTPEEKALQRFIREKQKRKSGSVFDLEAEDNDGETGLTHLGKALDLDGGFTARDDFDAADLSGSEADSDKDGALLKRRRPSDGNGDKDDEPEDLSEPARKKTKQEVMKEVVAKSKLHKYERQKAKEDDDELRERLDADLGDIMQLLHVRKPEPPKIAPAPPPAAGSSVNADRLAMIEGKSREAANKEYDARLRQMASDQRAAPTERSKSDEEKAKENAIKLQELEAARVRRMRGEEKSEESENEKEKVSEHKAEEPLEDVEERNDAADFGFSAPKGKQVMPTLDDEDEFELDDDLVASASDLESENDDDDGDSENDDQAVNGHLHEDEEDEFVKGILDSDSKVAKSATEKAAKVAYTYPCPRSHDELLDVVSSISATDLPTVIQRIRALYHPSLSAQNKEKLADFAEALVDHLAYRDPQSPSLPTIEQIIRHLHSLSRTYPERVATAFRKHLSALHERREPIAGDLVILLAIGSIYPTSDHFHQVVTPANILMARWLGLANPINASQLHTGAYLVSLCLRYQRISKRYIPEALRFTTKALQLAANQSEMNVQPHLNNVMAMAEQYRHLPAFADIFGPSVRAILQAIPSAKNALARLDILLSQARRARQPLALHNHRPRAIRTSIPKFEENFAPGRHYDPDRERTEASKLRNEYKRERKGAVRELRRDANFIAREDLRRKKEADAAYENKFRKLVAQINSEEGAGANEYARTQERRKKARK